MCTLAPRLAVAVPAPLVVAASRVARTGAAHVCGDNSIVLGAAEDPDPPLAEIAWAFAIGFSFTTAPSEGRQRKCQLSGRGKVCSQIASPFRVTRSPHQAQMRGCSGGSHFHPSWLTSPSPAPGVRQHGGTTSATPARAPPAADVDGRRPRRRSRRTTPASASCDPSVSEAGIALVLVRPHELAAKAGLHDPTVAGHDLAEIFRPLVRGDGLPTNLAVPRHDSPWKRVSRDCGIRQQSCQRCSSRRTSAPRAHPTTM